MSSVRVPLSVIREIERHAREVAPEECCGLLGGTAGVVGSLYRLRNVAETPHTRYWADVRDVVAAFRLMRERGEQLVGIYHSHPRGTPRPSETDIRHAFYPEAVYFIIALEPTPCLRAYRIADGTVEDIAYEVIGTPDK
jgi:proteasome lid subunit RPN8/RPN11